MSKRKDFLESVRDSEYNKVKIAPRLHLISLENEKRLGHVEDSRTVDDEERDRRKRYISDKILEFIKEDTFDRAPNMPIEFKEYNEDEEVDVYKVKLPNVI